MKKQVRRLAIIVIIQTLIICLMAGYMLIPRDKEDASCACKSLVADSISIESYEQEEESYYLGTYLLTAYCPCLECSEGYGYMTSTGVIASEGTTIAVDPSIIPYGTHLIIDGHEYIAQDCGGGVNGSHIDIFVESHENTFNDSYNGYHDVWLILN